MTIPVSIYSHLCKCFLISQSALQCIPLYFRNPSYSHISPCTLIPPCYLPLITPCTLLVPLDSHVFFFPLMPPCTSKYPLHSHLPSVIACTQCPSVLPYIPMFSHIRHLYFQKKKPWPLCSHISSLTYSNLPLLPVSARKHFLRVLRLMNVFLWNVFQVDALSNSSVNPRTKRALYHRYGHHSSKLSVKDLALALAKKHVSLIYS